MDVYEKRKRIYINDNDYFSFALGSEIAFNYNGNYYILNCDNKLWNKVKDMLKKNNTTEGIKLWWLKKSGEYEISEWSADFKDLDKKEDNIKAVESIKKDIRGVLVKYYEMYKFSQVIDFYGMEEEIFKILDDKNKN